MDEILNTDPSQPLEHVVEEHSRSSTRGWGYLVALFTLGAFLNLFSYLESFTRPTAADFSDETAITLMQFVMPIIVSAGLVIAWWTWHARGYEAGSRIDLRQRKLFWWDGPAPRVEREIEIDGLSKITFEDMGDETEHMVLWQMSGDKILVPERCVGNARNWAWAITSHFPHIAYDWTERYPSLRNLTKS